MKQLVAPTATSPATRATASPPKPSLTSAYPVIWNIDRQQSNTFLEAQRESSFDGILVVDQHRQINSFNQRPTASSIPR